MKIIEKQIMYNNKEHIDEINNCLDYILKNFNTINDNNIYDEQEMQLLTELIQSIEKYNIKANNYINKKRNKHIIIEIDNQSLDNQSLDNQSLENQSLDNQSLDNQSLDNQSLDNQSLDNQSFFQIQIHV